MMLSTSPSLPVSRSAPSTAAIHSSGARLVPANADPKSCLLQNRPLLKRSGVLQIEEDSTDIGSAMSSDADMPCSSSCTDEESLSEGAKRDSRCLLKQRQPRKVTLPKSTKQRANFSRTPLEPIMGTPAGMSEHPPLFFTSETGEADAEMQKVDNNGSSNNEAEGFRAPPGLGSPQRSRKPKSQFLLSTVPKVASPRRSRKPKAANAQSVLSTAPENLLSPSQVLVPSPTRRVRSAIIDKAVHEAAPLKVQMESQVEALVVDKSRLDPTQPVKKRLLSSSLEGLPKLKPGMPAKKRVTPWLLEEPERSMPAMPR